jgi:hypothetical protein
MTLGLSALFYAVALILFVLAAIPPAEVHHSRLVAVGLAFLAGSMLVG